MLTTAVGLDCLLNTDISLPCFPPPEEGSCVHCIHWFLHRDRAKGYFLKRLPDVPQMTSCVSVQECPLLPCMCLLWSLQIQTGENYFGNCRCNWQASVSRLRLRVWSCQDAPESHYSQDGIVHGFRFPITVLKVPHCSPGWFQRPGRWDGGKVGCTPAVTRRRLCGHVHFCLQTLLVRFTHSLSQQRQWHPWGSWYTGPTGSCREHGHRISQQAEAEITYWNWK